MKRRYRNLVTVSPSIKVVAVAGHDNDWSAYMGPSDWTDEEVAQSGDKLPKEQAEPLFYVLRTLRRYRR